jgi:hypothetical protein
LKRPADASCVKISVTAAAATSRTNRRMLSSSGVESKAGVDSKVSISPVNRFRLNCSDFPPPPIPVEFAHEQRLTLCMASVRADGDPDSCGESNCRNLFPAHDNRRAQVGDLDVKFAKSASSVDVMNQRLTGRLRSSVLVSWRIATAIYGPAYSRRSRNTPTAGCKLNRLRIRSTVAGPGVAPGEQKL